MLIVKIALGGIFGSALIAAATVWVSSKDRRSRDSLAQQESRNQAHDQLTARQTQDFAELSLAAREIYDVANSPSAGVHRAVIGIVGHPATVNRGRAAAAMSRFSSAVVAIRRSDAEGPAAAASETFLETFNRWNGEDHPMQESSRLCDALADVRRGVADLDAVLSSRLVELRTQ